MSEHSSPWSQCEACNESQLAALKQHRAALRQSISDSVALNEIAAEMSAGEWSADTLDVIADLVRRSGRTISDTPE